MADFPSHPPATLLRTTPQASKPASIRALVTFYQIASSLRKWKSGLNHRSHRSRPADPARTLLSGQRPVRFASKAAPKASVREGDFAFYRAMTDFHTASSSCQRGAGLLAGGPSAYPSSIRRPRGESTPRDRRDERNGTTATRDQERTSNFW